MNRLVTALTFLLLAAPASAQISRTEVMDRAEAYVYYPWQASADNLSASCVSDYDSAYQPGAQLGVAYDWGGFASLFQFDQRLEDGYGAGSPAFGDVFWCTVGVDCSGYVSRAWHTNQKYGTATIHEVSSAIAVDSMLPGDAFNKASYHIALFTHMLGNGEPHMWEAVGYNTHVNATGGWSYVDGFTPRRYDDITGTQVLPTDGTLNAPVQVDSFPFADSRSTSNSLSDLLDGCGVQPGTDESGPEVVYEVVLNQPGTLTVSVADDVGVDVDVHLYESWNTSDCVARHDNTLSRQLPCGRYLVVADTYGGEGNAGAFDLTMDFVASGAGSCDAPADPDYPGGFGDRCGYPGEPDLPFCNPTLGGEVCLYTTSEEPTSFCTAPCASDGDCAAMDGCCAEIAEGELYCIIGDLCQGEEPEDPSDPAPGDGPADDPDGGSDVPVTESEGPSFRADNGGCRSAGGRAPAWPLLAIFGLLLWRRRRA